MTTVEVVMGVLFCCDLFMSFIATSLKKKEERERGVKINIKLL